MGEMTPFSAGDNARERILALRIELEKLFYERDELISIDCEKIRDEFALLSFLEIAHESSLKSSAMDSSCVRMPSL